MCLDGYGRGTGPGWNLYRKHLRHLTLGIGTAEHDLRVGRARAKFMYCLIL